MSSERPSRGDAGPAVAGRGDLFVVSAPSGAGKTTIIRALLRELANDPHLYYSVSHTDRPRRSDELEGRDYHFVDRDAFREMIGADAFLEWAEVHGQLKGTAAAPVIERLEAGVDVLMDIDVQGAAQVRARYPATQSVFIMPPSFAELERRLRDRALDDEAQIRRRLNQAVVELRQYRHYRYVMINDRVEEASRVLAALIIARRHRRARIQDRIDRVMADLPADA